MSKFKKSKEESELLVALIAQVIETQWGRQILPEGDGPAEKLQREALVEAVWRDTNPVWAWQEALKALVVEGTGHGKAPRFGDVREKVSSFLRDPKYPRRQELLKWHKDRKSEQLGYRV
ncbi:MULTISPECIES: hypothetical protein [Corynebacterium]|uniref:hypothetical protein n=1 Tax=Corynebacterium TaxID=1716 RepID=UPI001EEB8B1A|nr:hypothetical protein [Corynebacterium sp. BWA136]MDK2583688.1 hypothetical protein [Corynebacterium sp. BWA136]